VSTRLVAGIWWFFTLIMVSSYTANLAAFLTVENLSDPFKNVEDLVNNKQSISFGLKKRGSTEEYFRVRFRVVVSRIPTTRLSVIGPHGAVRIRYNGT